MKFSLTLFLLTVFCKKKKYNIVLNSNTQSSNVFSILEKDDLVLSNSKMVYTLELSERSAKKLKRHPGVKIMEEDKEIKMASYKIVEDDNNARKDVFSFQRNSPWGLSRISGHIDTYEYIKDGGKDVTVYVLDTGIDENHPEFEGRAKLKFNGVYGSPFTDEQGHGTHCAGIIGSKTYGVAKKSTLVGVKVLDKNGAGTISRLISGIDFVIDDYNKLLKQNIKNERRPSAVVNMSIGGEKSEILNYLIGEVSNTYGIHFSTAAGNEHKDACKFSPSSSSISFTIGASDSEDRVAVFSNKGKCVDFYAPGVGIESTWPGGKTKIVSGTSMASPHVAGMMAIYLGFLDFSPNDLKKRMSLDAEDSVILEGTVFGIFSNKKPFASLTTLYKRLKMAIE